MVLLGRNSRPHRSGKKFNNVGAI